MTEIITSHPQHIKGGLRRGQQKNSGINALDSAVLLCRNNVCGALLDIRSIYDMGISSDCGNIGCNILYSEKIRQRSDSI
jgi:uncharacterized protein with von Willebrand factor type A (vWA) domain